MKLIFIILQIGVINVLVIQTENKTWHAQNFTYGIYLFLQGTYRYTVWVVYLNINYVPLPGQ